MATALSSTEKGCSEYLLLKEQGGDRTLWWPQGVHVGVTESSESQPALPWGGCVVNASWHRFTVAAQVMAS